MIIYVARNKSNGSEYIGMTSRPLQRRRKEHERAAMSGRPGSFLSALRKYGFDTFDWVVLYTTETRDDLCRAERQYIAERKPSYNQTLGGDGWEKGVPMPFGHAQKVGAASKRAWDALSVEQRAARGRAVSAAKLGVSVPQTYVSKLRGRKLSDETRRRMSEGMKLSRARRKALQ